MILFLLLVYVNEPEYAETEKKETQTTILIKDGETAVIGGIFKIRKTNPMTQVPFLGNLPVIGGLFRDEVDESRNEELIVFITPQIIEPGRGKGEQIPTTVIGAGL